MPLLEIALLIAGLGCAGLGGDLFVRGAVGAAQWARVPPGLIGATIAAFATSTPELSVSITSALAGQPQIALGDALGSNVVNVALVLGVLLSMSAMRCPRHAVKRDFPMAALVPGLTAVLFADGVLSRVDAVLLLALFGAWLARTILEALDVRGAAESGGAAMAGWGALLRGAAGLALLLTGAQAIVHGARAVALASGVDAFVVGATIVAVGTSVPELATAIVSKLRGVEEIGLGAVLGSNIFNGLFIVGVSASIHPIAVPLRELALVLGFGFVAVAITYPARTGRIGRWRGALLLALYLLYLGTIGVPTRP